MTLSKAEAYPHTNRYRVDTASHGDLPAARHFEADPRRNDAGKPCVSRLRPTRNSMGVLHVLADQPGRDPREFSCRVDPHRQLQHPARRSAACARHHLSPPYGGWCNEPNLASSYRRGQSGLGETFLEGGRYHCIDDNVVLTVIPGLVSLVPFPVRSTRHQDHGDGQEPS